MNLNPCRCGNRPEVVTQTNGLVRIGCVLGKCADLICVRANVAEAAWNEAHPMDDEPTLPNNERPKAEDYRGPWYHTSPVNTAKTVLAMPAPKACECEHYEVQLPDWSEA
jgi:hypothetical protein